MGYEIALTEAQVSYGCSEKSTNGVSSIECSYTVEVANARPRWWFIVFSRCFPSNITVT